MSTFRLRIMWQAYMMYLPLRLKEIYLSDTTMARLIVALGTLANGVTMLAGGSAYTEPAVNVAITQIASYDVWGFIATALSIISLFGLLFKTENAHFRIIEAMGLVLYWACFWVFTLYSTAFVAAEPIVLVLSFWLATRMDD